MFLKTEKVSVEVLKTILFHFFFYFCFFNQKPLWFFYIFILYSMCVYVCVCLCVCVWRYAHAWINMYVWTCVCFCGMSFDVYIHLNVIKYMFCLFFVFLFFLGRDILMPLVQIHFSSYNFSLDSLPFPSSRKMVLFKLQATSQILACSKARNVPQFFSRHQP